MSVKFNVVPTNIILLRRGVDNGGRVQKYIDSEVVRLCDPKVPMRNGVLKKALGTTFGSGIIRYNTPYAKRQYYENRGKGQRGKLWFERTKAEKGKQILAGAKEMAGAK